MKLIRTSSHNVDFISLVEKLDEDLRLKDGNEHSFYAQYNKIDQIKHVVVAYLDEIPAACGAIKEFNNQTMEVKRMFVEPKFRNQGLASAILAELESWATHLTFKKCVLETGKKQPEAIQLYLKSGYSIIDNYGQYKGIANSLCFEKVLMPKQ